MESFHESHAKPRSGLVGRALGSLPDAALAAWFVALWISPLAFGPAAVRTGLVVMLVEFVLVHASAMLGAIVLSERVPRATRLTGLGAMAALYLVFIAAFVAEAGSWWPLAVFAWLLLAKAALAMGRPGPDLRHRLQSAWAVAVMTYLVGVAATVMLPVPRLGLTPAVVAELGLSGSGLWSTRPQTVIAFGAFYFAVQAATRLFDLRLPAHTLPGLGSPRA
ncbi:hypothetical protein H0E84_12280 [Luteimonas sp. SJ-92]|uniref:Uncharacterized protein n=1 Tax=Luteimonas salinisoli TaxID=2752307 RepID=A0A853JF94_9GAMM|nr:hypothetical protein [Luteimonas salinisoli]NZA27158.1 hypothetical protein [Luteimonas salinisoli]